MKKKIHFSNFLLLSALCALCFLTFSNLTDLNAKSFKKAPGYEPNAYNCVDVGGSVISFGNSCIVGKGSCLSNDCPKGSTKSGSNQ